MLGTGDTKGEGRHDCYLEGGRAQEYSLGRGKGVRAGVRKDHLLYVRHHEMLSCVVAPSYLHRTLSSQWMPGTADSTNPYVCYAFPV